MKRVVIPVLLVACATAPASSPVVPASRAASVTITRDDWGIAHVHGRTDADAVFGMIYAQAEDDFNRVETNYLIALGRLSEAEGDSAIYRDLRARLFVSPDSLRAKYLASPAWLRALMDAWADGLNFYLARHPEVRPRVLTRFEPWMPLAFSEGSIGGDVEKVSLDGLRAFYGREPVRPPSDSARATPEEPRGSNGIAIAASNSATGHALLLINPHTSFFFRSELQMRSDEGLNAYGAVTWGQFFVYQGFNDRAGWMHTSSGVDNVDEYAERVARRGDRLVYRHGDAERPVVSERITIRYRTPSGMAAREFVAYRTHHGPVVREADGRWVSVRLMQDPVNALTQSYTRTRARSYGEFLATMQLHTNSSNNTVYADADGTIAYFHANFIPRRDPRFDWSAPVDGSDPATEWGPPLSVEESPLVVNPRTGWLYNTNNWPYSAAGADSPVRARFPSYVERGVENPRGVHAMQLLRERRNLSMASLIEVAYDSHLPAFADLVPVLLRDYDALPASDSLRTMLAGPVAALRAWDFRWSAASIPTSLAVYWGDDLWQRTADRAGAEKVTVYDYMLSRATPAERVRSFLRAVRKLEADFGSWQVPWGEINRFQRLTGDIVQSFSDAAPSIPVPFTSSRWGSLASFGARQYPGTKRIYGTSGNSFVAVVEFGDRVRARAVTAGGESGHPGSRHFNDQAMRYSLGNLREVYFHPSQLAGHIEREYHPGEER